MTTSIPDHDPISMAPTSTAEPVAERLSDAFIARVAGAETGLPSRTSNAP